MTRLTYIRPSATRTTNNRRLSEYSCTCGRVVNLLKSQVDAGRYKSCGCLRSEYYKNQATRSRGCQPPNKVDSDTVAAFRGKRNNLRAGAKRRGLSYTLTDEELSDLIFADCFYCGKPPQHKFVRWRRPGAVINYNGIDRKDSAKGYERGNCVTCCRPCNSGKGTMSVIEFISHVRLIHENVNRHGRWNGEVV